MYLPFSSSKSSIDIVIGVFKSFKEDLREFVVELSLSSFWADWSFSMGSIINKLFFCCKYEINFDYLPDSFSCELSIIAMFIESFVSVASIDSLLFVSS